MTYHSDLSRRNFLLASAITTEAAIVGCVGIGDDEQADNTSTTTATPTLTPTPTPEPTPPEIGSDHPAAQVDHWTAFPTDDELWSRWADPYDVTDEDRRWLAMPTEDGVRCLVEGDDPPGNAGFYVDIGNLGDIEQIEISVDTLQSDATDGQQILLALYLDVDNNGKFFEWETADNGGERFVGFGEDIEGITVKPTEDTITVDLDTEFELFPLPEGEVVTLRDLKNSEIDKINGLNDAALQFSVVGAGPGTVEEILVHEIAIRANDPVGDDDWPMYAHNQLNNGRSTSPLPTTEAVEARWIFETGGPVRSTSAVVGGTAFVGSDDGKVYAIDVASGDQRWSFETGDSVRSSPAVLSTVVIIGSDDGTIYALSTGSGSEVWTFETGGPVRSSPTVERDSRTTEVNNAVAIGNDDGVLYVIEARTGEAIKQIQTNGAIRAPPIILLTANYDWEVGVGSTDGEVYYWVPTFQDGLEHSMDAGGSVWAPISKPHMRIQPDIWYRANDEGTLFKFDNSEGGSYPAVWTYEAGAAIRTAPVLGRSLVYVVSQDGRVHAVRISSGEVEWTLDVGSAAAGSPAVTDEMLVVAGDDTVYGLNLETGEQHWTYQAGDSIRSSVAVANGMVYVGSDDGNVHALEPR